MAVRAPHLGHGLSVKIQKIGDPFAATMGSDSVGKRARSLASLRRRVLVLAKYLVVGVTAIILVLLLIPPRLPSFSPDDIVISPQCRDLAVNFDATQQSSSHTLVLGCHRKWCHSWGYCQPCSGIGSRTRYVLGMVQHAMNMGVRVELDSPQRGMLVRQNAIHRDPLNFLGEVLHKRWYGNQIAKSWFGWSGDSQEWLQRDTFYLHMTPDRWRNSRPGGLPAFDWDPCLFEILYQPSPELHAELHRQLALWGKPSIGIHLRTGDAKAYGIGDSDVRVKVDHETALERLLECADDYSQIHSVSTNGRYFLATDNAEIHDLARQNKRFFILDSERSSYFISDDSLAWLEVLLLSHAPVIVANERTDKNYRGGGDRISTFARLAAHIRNRTLLPCPLEV